MLIYIIISEKEIQCAISETELPFLAYFACEQYLHNK